MRYYDKPNNYYAVEVHIADIHFKPHNIEKQFAILKEQFIDRIARIPFNILSIDGDLFDKKFMANSNVIVYANEFIRLCVELCKQKRATLFLISGTESHDAGQLKLYYTYTEDPDLDIRIIERISMEQAQGLKILCIPEEYGKGRAYYQPYLDDWCDTVFFHGTFVGSVYGASREDLNSSKYPIFTLESFPHCRGPIIGGHVHKVMCLNSYIYYCSNPIRDRFGEEDPKGFIILSHNFRYSSHLVSFMEIESFRYDTIPIGSIGTTDPNEIVKYLDNLHNSGVDYIRLDLEGSNYELDTMMSNLNMDYIKVIGKSKEEIRLEKEARESQENKYKDMEFLLDKNLSEYDKFCMYVNLKEGNNFITVEQLKKLLEG